MKGVGVTTEPAAKSPAPTVPEPARDLLWAAAMVASAVLYYELSSFALSLLFLACLACLCWARTPLAVALVPLAVPLHMLPKTLHVGHDPIFSLGETVIVLITLVVAAQELVEYARDPRQVSLLRRFVPATPFLWPALLFFVAATIATAAAQFHTVALRGYRWWIIEPMLYYWLILKRLRGPRGATLLVLALAAAGSVISALGAWQILFRPHDLVNASTIGQHFVAAVYQNENNLSLLIDRALPAALALILAPGWVPLFAAGREPGSRRIDEHWIQGALLCASALMVYILFRTGSRGGEVAAVVCAAALVLVCQWRRKPALAGLAALAIVALLLAHYRVSTFLSGGHGLSNGAHQSVWRSALRMVRDHPIVGVGPDNFLYYYSNDDACAPHHIAHWYYSQDNQTNFERCISHPHNMFLDFWLSTGLLGLVAALALLGLFAVLGLRLLRRADASRKGPLLGALAAMLALVVHGEVDNSYFLPDLAVYFWLCIGVVTILHAAEGAP